MTLAKTSRALVRGLGILALFAAGAPQALAQTTSPQPAPAPSQGGTPPTPAPGEKPVPKHDDQRGWDFGVSLATVSLDEQFAKKNRLGTDATELDLDIDYRFSRHVVAEGTIGLVFFDDKAQVSAQVCPTTNPNCNPDTANSSETGYAFAGSLRGEIPVGDVFVLQGLAGYKYWTHSREIANCSNCPSGSSVSFDGPFVGAGVGLNLGPTTLSLRYQHVFSEDVGGQVVVGLMF